MDLYLGVDVGTTVCKAVLYDSSGRSIAQAQSSGYVVHRPNPGWAEQSADDWWEAARSCIQDVLHQREGHRVAAVGVVGQWSQLFVDGEGRPHGRAFTWQDGRAEAESEELSAVSQETWQTWQGATVPHGAATPSARLLWLRRHRPEVLAPGSRLLQAKDWVIHRLTGAIVTDLTSMVWVVNQRTGRLDPALAALLGIQQDLIPAIHQPFEVVGQVNDAAAQLTGVPAGTPVVAGWIDTWAGILGTGMGLGSRGFDLAGTSEAVGIGGSRPRHEPRGLLTVPLDARTDIVYGLTNAGADSFHWAAEALYPTLPLEAAYATMESEAETCRAGEDGLIFLPYLSGERSPVWDPVIRAAFVGMDRSHRRANLGRAVYEGLAFCVRQLLEAAATAVGVTPQALRVSGGGADSLLANQLKADVTGLPVETIDAPDAGTLGAAMLAAIGSGSFRDYDAAVAEMVRIRTVFEPSMTRHQALAATYQRYCGLYTAIAPYSPSRSPDGDASP